MRDEGITCREQQAVTYH